MNLDFWLQIGSYSVILVTLAYAANALTDWRKK